MDLLKNSSDISGEKKLKIIVKKRPPLYVKSILKVRLPNPLTGSDVPKKATSENSLIKYRQLDSNQDGNVSSESSDLDNMAAIHGDVGLVEYHDDISRVADDSILYSSNNDSGISINLAQNDLSVVDGLDKSMDVYAVEDTQGSRSGMYTSRSNHGYDNQSPHPYGKQLYSDRRLDNQSLSNHFYDSPVPSNRFVTRRSNSTAALLGSIDNTTSCISSYLQSVGSSVRCSIGRLGSLSCSSEGLDVKMIHKSEQQQQQQQQRSVCHEKHGPNDSSCCLADHTYSCYSMSPSHLKSSHGISTKRNAEPSECSSPEDRPSSRTVNKNSCNQSLKSKGQRTGARESKSQSYVGRMNGKQTNAADESFKLKYQSSEKPSISCTNAAFQSNSMDWRHDDWADDVVNIWCTDGCDDDTDDEILAEFNDEQSCKKPVHLAAHGRSLSSTEAWSSLSNEYSLTRYKNSLRYRSSMAAREEYYIRRKERYPSKKYKRKDSRKESQKNLLKKSLETGSVLKEKLATNSAQNYNKHCSNTRVSTVSQNQWNDSGICNETSTVRSQRRSSRLPGRYRDDSYVWDLPPSLQSSTSSSNQANGSSGNVKSSTCSTFTQRNRSNTFSRDDTPSAQRTSKRSRSSSSETLDRFSGSRKRSRTLNSESNSAVGEQVKCSKLNNAREHVSQKKKTDQRTKSSTTSRTYCRRRDELFRSKLDDKSFEEKFSHRENVDTAVRRMKPLKGVVSHGFNDDDDVCDDVNDFTNDFHMEDFGRLLVEEDDTDTAGSSNDDDLDDLDLDLGIDCVTEQSYNPAYISDDLCPQGIVDLSSNQNLPISSRNTESYNVVDDSLLYGMDSGDNFNEGLLSYDTIQGEGVQNKNLMSYDMNYGEALFNGLECGADLADTMEERVCVVMLNTLGEEELDLIESNLHGLLEEQQENRRTVPSHGDTAVGVEDEIGKLVKESVSADIVVNKDNSGHSGVPAMEEKRGQKFCSEQDEEISSRGIMDKIPGSENCIVSNESNKLCDVMRSKLAEQNEVVGSSNNSHKAADNVTDMLEDVLCCMPTPPHTASMIDKEMNCISQVSQTSLLSGLVNLEEDMCDELRLRAVDVTRFSLTSLPSVDEISACCPAPRDDLGIDWSPATTNSELALPDYSESKNGGVRCEDQTNNRKSERKLKCSVENEGKVTRRQINMKNKSDVTSNRDTVVQKRLMKYSEEDLIHNGTNMSISAKFVAEKMNMGSQIRRNASHTVDSHQTAEQTLDLINESFTNKGQFSSEKEASENKLVGVRGRPKLNSVRTSKMYSGRFDIGVGAEKKTANKGDDMLADRRLRSDIRCQPRRLRSDHNVTPR